MIHEWFAAATSRPSPKQTCQTSMPPYMVPLHHSGTPCDMMGTEPASNHFKFFLLWRFSWNKVAASVAPSNLFPVFPPWRIQPPSLRFSGDVWLISTFRRLVFQHHLLLMAHDSTAISLQGFSAWLKGCLFHTDRDGSLLRRHVCAGRWKFLLPNL